MEAMVCWECGMESPDGVSVALPCHHADRTHRWMTLANARKVARAVLGVTHEDVDELRVECGCHRPDHGDLADRLEALLPPRR